MADDLKTKPAQAPLKAHQNDVDLLAIVEQQAKDLAELRAILMATIQSQPKVSPDTLWAKQHTDQLKIKDELDAKAALFQETCEKRTQWEANKLNPDGKKLFKVKVGWCPEVILRANDQVMAKAYYDQLCGIVSVNVNHNNPKMTTYTMLDVTDDPAAQTVVKHQWEYKAAA